MAAHSTKVMLSLGRVQQHGFGPFSQLSRVTYATGLSTNFSHGNKSFPERGNRGPSSRKPWRSPGAPRTEKMPVDQDWTAVYPAATPFRPDSVPLPVRMGYPVKRGVPPQKKGNLELIKIPNFLHLTPAAIKKHCEALKPFCTEWPSALATDDTCDEHFPIKVESADYLSAGTSVRNPAARVVHLKVKVSSLNMDDHARKKMRKLVGDRRCKETDVITIKTDSCPLRRQNYDYAMYLLTVLYHESWVMDLSQTLPLFLILQSQLSLTSDKLGLSEKTEPWEAEKTVADMEEYSWEDSPSQKNILNLLVRMKVSGEGEAVREELLGRAEVQEYKDSVTRLKNEGDSESTTLQYRDAVKKLFNL